MTTRENRWRNDQSSLYLIQKNNNKNKNNPKVKIGASEINNSQAGVAPGLRKVFDFVFSKYYAQCL